MQDPKGKQCFFVGTFSQCFPTTCKKGLGMLFNLFVAAFNVKEYVWLFPALLNAKGPRHIPGQVLFAVKNCYVFLTVYFCDWHCLRVTWCILRMEMLKLNFKYHLRYFKTGMIHDNHMKLENSTGHDKIGTWICHKTANDGGAGEMWGKCNRLKLMQSESVSLLSLVVWHWKC